MSYRRLETEEYIKNLKDYSEQQIENVRKVRDTWECMSVEQFDFLVKAGQIKKLAKIKKPRNYYVCPENGGFYYLNHYHKWYEKVGEWKE